MNRGRKNRRWRVILFLSFLFFATLLNYRIWWNSSQARATGQEDGPSTVVGDSVNGGGDGYPTVPPIDAVVQTPQPAHGDGLVIEVDPNAVVPPLRTHAAAASLSSSHVGDGTHGGDPATDVPDPDVSNYTYAEALALFERNLRVHVEQGNVEQPTKEYVDILELPDHGVLLPHDDALVAPREQWMACEPRNAEFTHERDVLCQQYLSNYNNMRSIKAMSAILKKGRTIKFKIRYYHNNIEAIVKVSQKKFFFEPASEYLAYAVDRELNLTRTPTTAYVPLPLDYMKAASSVLGPFYSQWFQAFVPKYDMTRENFVPCSNEQNKHVKGCSLTAVQLWMKDVHSALMSNLAVPYEYDEYFAEKFLRPMTKHKFPPKPLRLRAIGDILVRFMFDFLLGNTDRGLNDHNNFVYGGCDNHTRCTPKAPEERTLHPAKYAFIDQGSSFYSHKEPEDNPFTGNLTDILICRFRRSIYERFRKFLPTEADKQPFITAVRKKLPKNIFTVIHTSVFNKCQTRIEKLITVVEGCLAKFTGEDVFSLPEYWEV